MPLESSEEMESYDTIVSVDGDRVFILLEKVALQLSLMICFM